MSPSESAASVAGSHFRAVSRHAVHLLGALRASEALWNRDVQVIDLGLGGARVEAPETIEAGTIVELVLETPHLCDPLKLHGAVAWSRALPASEGAGAQIGVRFEHANGRSARTLSELL